MINKCHNIYERNESNHEKIEKKVKELDNDAIMQTEDAFDMLSEMMAKALTSRRVIEKLNGIVEKVARIAEYLQELYDEIDKAVKAEKAYSDIERTESEVEVLTEYVFELEAREAALMERLDTFDYDDLLDDDENEESSQDGDIIEFEECEELSDIEEFLLNDDLLEYLSEDDEEE